MREISGAPVVCVLEKNYEGKTLAVLWEEQGFVSGVGGGCGWKAGPRARNGRLFVDEETGQHFLRILIPLRERKYEQKVYWRPVSKSMADLIIKESKAKEKPAESDPP